MTRRNAWPSQAGIWLGLHLVLAPFLGAQTPSRVLVVPTLTLSAYTFQYTGPVVHSFARGIAYDDRGRRVYQELILGHQVRDITHQFVMYEAGGIVSPNGYANNSTGNLGGALYTCYDAAMVAHMNAYNLHQDWWVEPVCMEIVHVEWPPEPPEENCPILLDLELNGFHLSGPDPAVRFDIDADGALDSIAWTKAGEDDAFLCLDRNHNGLIDDGRELFGFATPLLSGERARVGYRALAELDQAALGGNGDGKLDASDSMFAELCAWSDANRDGMSQAQEIQPLDQVGVVALEYGYRTTRLRDSYGNLFRYVSRATMRRPSGILRSWPTFDVIFAEP